MKYKDFFTFCKNTYTHMTKNDESKKLEKDIAEKIKINKTLFQKNSTCITT